MSRLRKYESEQTEATAWKMQSLFEMLTQLSDRLSGHLEHPAVPALRPQWVVAMLVAACGLSIADCNMLLQCLLWAQWW